MKLLNTQPKATFCSGKTCVTIQGQTANVINNVIAIVIVVSAVAAISKMLKAA